jgi:hypothetical protein
MSLESPEKITLFAKPAMGEVEQIITETQAGRVKFQATYWPARLYNPEYEITLVPDTPVTVIDRQGITLLVLPVNEMQQSNLEDQEAMKQKAIASNGSGWTQRFGFLFGSRLN